MLVTRRPAACAASPRASPYAPLREPVHADACIAGAGLSGLIAAYLLLRDRRSVAVLDERFPGEPPQVADVLPLASGVEASFALLEREQGPRAARNAAHALAAATEVVQAIVRREHIACDFERLDGYFFAGEGQSFEDLEEEAAAARRSGLPHVEALAFAPIETDAPRHCLHWPNHAQLHEGKLAAALARCLANEGARLFGGVRAEALRPGPPAVIEASDGGRIEADLMVVGLPALASRRPVHAVALSIPRGSVTRALYWEVAAGCRRTARLAAGTGRDEVLLASGEESAATLERWARERFTRAGDCIRHATVSPPAAPDVFAFTGQGAGRDESAFVSMACEASPLSRAAAAALLVKEFHDQAPGARE